MMKILSPKYKTAQLCILLTNICSNIYRPASFSPLVLCFRSNIRNCVSFVSLMGLDKCEMKSIEKRLSSSFDVIQKKSYASKCKDDNPTSSNASDVTDCGNPPGLWPTGNRSNFKFHSETEAIMNRQFAMEMKAFYYYLSMAGYFGRVDVALPGCESFFLQMHHEEHGHAIRFLNYIKMRGGLISLCSIEPPVNQDWKCPLTAFKGALQLELEIAERLDETNTIAEKHKDINASDFIVTGFMEEQMESVNQIARLVTVLSGIGDQSLARFIFDKDLLEHYVSPEFNILKNRKIK